MNRTQLTRRLVAVTACTWIAATPAVAACWDIVTKGNTPVHNPDGTCLAGSDHTWQDIEPGVSCAVPASAGGPGTVFCLEGVSEPNPDGTAACDTSGSLIATPHTFSAKITCLVCCRQPGPPA